MPFGFMNPQNQQAMPQQPQGGVGGFLGNNSSMLMNLGAGLLDRRQNANVPLSQVAQAATIGSAFDTKRKDKNQTLQYLVSKGIAGNEDEARQIMSSPELLAQALKPDEYKVVDDQLARIGRDGSVSWSTPPAAQGGGLFKGNSVDAQGLNHLIERGMLTPDQAAQVAAGKTVTGPNGEILFMTPEGLSGAKGGATQLTEPKVSDAQKQTLGFATRLEKSDAIISQEANTAAGMDKGQSIRHSLPGGNYWVSSEYQKFDQAKRDFVNAVLRRESGAAISADEFANAEQQYFPQPGDGPEVISQKEAARRTVIENLRREAGPAAGQADPAAMPMDGTTSSGVRYRVIGG